MLLLPDIAHAPTASTVVNLHVCLAMMVWYCMQDEDADLLADLGILRRQGFSIELQAGASKEAQPCGDAAGVAEAGLKPVLEPVSDVVGAFPETW